MKYKRKPDSCRNKIAAIILIILISFGSTPAQRGLLIKSGTDKTLNIQLSPTALELEQVTVTGDYFDKAITEIILAQ